MAAGAMPRGVSVVGLGRVGAPLAATLASRGFEARALDGRGAYASSVGDCCRGAGLIALVQPCPEFADVVAALQAPVGPLGEAS